MLKAVSFLFLALCCVHPSLAAASTSIACKADFYRLSDGSGVDIAPSDDAHFRWRRLDGTTGLLSARADGQWSSTLGWTGKDDGKIVDLRNCANGEIRFDGLPGKRLPLVTKEVRFSDGGVELSGRLVLPAGRARVPIVVIVHGSESTPGTQLYALQRLLPAQGVGAFVYDKRGTGGSKGGFTHDIRILAADADAALDTARSSAGARAGRVGYYGSSQGGWDGPAGRYQRQSRLRYRRIRARSDAYRRGQRSTDARHDPGMASGSPKSPRHSRSERPRRPSAGAASSRDTMVCARCSTNIVASRGSGTCAAISPAS